MVDLVRDQADAAITAIAGQPGEVGGADHRSGRVGRARDDQPVESAQIGEELGCRLVMGVLADFDQHRLDVERRQDVAIGRVPRDREPHSVAGLEGGEKGKLERGRRAGRDDDLGGVDGDAVLGLVVAGNRLPQRRDTERIGIADPFAPQGAASGIEHRLGRRGPRLADFEMDHVGAPGLPLVGGAQHVHRDKGRHQAPPGRAQSHVRAHPSGLKTRRVDAG